MSGLYAFLPREILRNIGVLLIRFVGQRHLQHRGASKLISSLPYHDLEYCINNCALDLYFQQHAWLVHKTPIMFTPKQIINMQKVNSDHLTPLLEMCSRKEVSKALRLLEQDADPNLCDDRGYSPLILTCCNHGGSDLVQALLRNDADVNHTMRGSSALHIALHHQMIDHDVVDALLSQGKNILDQHDCAGFTPRKMLIDKWWSSTDKHLFQLITKHNIGDMTTHPALLCKYPVLGRIYMNLYHTCDRAIGSLTEYGKCTMFLSAIFLFCQSFQKWRGRFLSLARLRQAFYPAAHFSAILQAVLLSIEIIMENIENVTMRKFLCWMALTIVLYVGKFEPRFIGISSIIVHTENHD